MQTDRQKFIQDFDLDDQVLLKKYKSSEKYEAKVSGGKKENSNQNHSKSSKNQKEKFNDSNDEDEEDEEIVGPDPRKSIQTNLQDIVMDNLPTAEFYQKSYMHRDVINQILCASKTQFIITISIDGHIKFWAKAFRLIQFVQHFRAHKGEVTSASLSQYHERLCTTSPSDNTLKIFDVVNTDLHNMVKLSFVPYQCQYIRVEGTRSEIAVSERTTGQIFIIQDDSELKDKIIKVLSFHKSNIRAIVHDYAHNAIISTDQEGQMEIWDPQTYSFPKHKDLAYSCQSETHFYQLRKDQVFALNISLSPSCRLLAVFASDRVIRIFDMQTGQIIRKIDESNKKIIAIQDEKDPAISQTTLQMMKMDRLEFDRKMAVEREVDKMVDFLAQFSMAFDETDSLFIFPSVIGIKYYSIHKDEIVQVIGKQELNDRFIKVALYQGAAMKNPSGQGGTQQKETDPTLVCSAFKQHRIFVFTKREPEDMAEKGVSRDVFNERPSQDEQQQLLNQNQVQMNNAATLASSGSGLNGANVMIQTTMGDIYIKLFDKECPKTVENFLTHAQNGYYENLIFHRVIQGFMNQTGCPKGDGTGGESIWGGEFEDEFHPQLQHDVPFTVSMANAGPNTNGSQFFITVTKCPWLDNQHTVFGRVVKGTEIALEINNVYCDKFDKPLNNVKIMKIKIF